MLRRPTPALRLPPHRATTAQACAIYPFALDTPGARSGVVLGHDVTAGGGLFTYDPFAAYAVGAVTNPNVLVAGEPGAGKSAMVKCLLARCCAASPRWVAICDPKGEYTALGHELGLTVVRLMPGGSERLNPLEADDEGQAARDAVLTALVGSALHRDLGPLEEVALGWAADAAGTRRRVATLPDVVRVLASPTAAMAARAAMRSTMLARALDEVRLGLVRLCDGALRGMFDGPSTVRLNPAGPGVVLDLSGVGHDPEALGLVMVAATGWLGARLREPGPARLQVLDEAWALLSAERTARYLQACWKLGRAWGVANLAVVHRLSDLRSQADDGTATAKVAAGLLADTQTRVLFRQSADQAGDAAELLGLTEAETALLPRLVRGRALWRVGPRSSVVQHMVGPAEAAWCDTDGAMRR